MIVNSSNEWGRLESVVVGSATGANWPVLDPKFAKNWEDTLYKDRPHPKGPALQEVIDIANYDLDVLAAVFRMHGATVYRPSEMTSSLVMTPNWHSDQFYTYCPRDTHLVMGNKVIETPMAYPSRQFESDYYADIRSSAIADGCNWYAAPRPMHDGRDEPIFDAANCLRMNDTILYLKSSTGNDLGAKWLQSTMPEVKVVVLDNVYAYAHIDSTISVIRDGLVVLNASRINESNCPDVFDGWDKIWFDDPVATEFVEYPYASKWIGMNLMMLDPYTAIVDKHQHSLIRSLSDRYVTVIPLELRMSRTLGGGFHCVTLDLHRR